MQVLHGPNYQVIRVKADASTTLNEIKAPINYEYPKMNGSCVNVHILKRDSLMVGKKMVS